MGLVSMIDVSGRITEDSFAAPNPTIVAHRPPGMRRKLLGFARLLDGSFLVMESAVSLTPGQWIPTDTVSVTRVFRPDSQVLLAQWERAGRRDPLGSVSDFLSLSASTEGVFVAGSAPPRGAIISTRGRQFPTFTAFEGIVPPPYDAADARELATELHRRGVPDAEIARLSHVYPAVAGAIRVADTWFVSSPTSRERFRLMSGCDHRPFRDVIAGPDIAAIHLLEDGLVLVRDHIEDGMLRVEFSSYSDFPTPCKP